MNRSVSRGYRDVHLLLGNGQNLTGTRTIAILKNNIIILRGNGIQGTINIYTSQ